MTSNRQPRYSKFNHPAHCEGKAAAHNGECHHNNPYDPDGQPRQFRQWSAGYQHVIEAFAQNIHFTVAA